MAVLGLCLGMGIAYGEPYDEQLASKIDTYLAGKNSPLSGLGSVFVSAGVQYNVDPRLIVAIAGAESSFGTAWSACARDGNNAWSWFYNGNCQNSPFSSFSAGIMTVTKFMRRSYLNKGFTTIDLIRKKYCVSGCNDWAPNVTQFYTDLGGDVNDLSYSRTLIDFEQFAGESSVFESVQPPLAIGIATISGGQLLNAATSLPVDRSVVYGTANFCSDCASTITIDFSQPVSNFSVFLLNGETSTVTYTVMDDDGETETVSLPANSDSGAQTVYIQDTEIMQVVITSGVGQWDFLIDNVQFEPM